MSIFNRIFSKLARLAGLDSKEVVKNVHCSEFEVNNWVISDFIVNKLAPIVGTHPYPIGELNLMVAAVFARTGAQCAPAAA